MDKKRVLIIDDDGVFAANLGKYLEIMGYEADMIGTGEAALELIENKKPDALLLDLKLPDIDGSQIIRKMKEISPQAIPIIITAYLNEFVEENLKKSGAFEVLYKPVEFDDVINVLDKALHITRSS
jgi:DNA-binding NtrC family response regulator